MEAESQYAAYNKTEMTPFRLPWQLGSQDLGFGPERCLERGRGIHEHGVSAERQHGKIRPAVRVPDGIRNETFTGNETRRAQA